MPDFCGYAAELTRRGVKYLENEPMSAHSTFRIGGSARFFVMPSCARELEESVNLANKLGIRAFVCGRSSNLVYPDEGFAGAVITTTAMSDTVFDNTSVTASAGVSLTELAVAAMRRGLTGLEFAYGIPGSVGGAIYMNAGAYDGEIAGVLAESTYYDTESGECRTIPLECHDFGYRTSVYRSHLERLIVSAKFTLDMGDAESIRAKMDDFMSRRREKQPLEYPSAGSAFKRVPGRYTAAMIDEAGLKGYAVGGAQVSPKHAGFIVNTGGATAADVRALSDHIRSVLFEKFGVNIENEIIFVE